MLLHSLQPGPYFKDLVCEYVFEPGIRVKVLVLESAKAEIAVSHELIIYATPNGNTLEQTWGCAKAEGLDWHFDIQHVAAQARTYQAAKPNTAMTVAVVEADTLSWPAWRAKHKDHAKAIKDFVEQLLKHIPGRDHSVTITGHSGGGSFLTGFLNSQDEIPSYVRRISYLDSNYSYDDTQKHGDKLRAWLNGDDKRKLMVIAYDDREISLNGKKVVGPTGGTYRATQRMTDFFKQHTDVKEVKNGDWITQTAFSGKAVFHVHTNPENKILHTALVGEMNGLLAALNHERPTSPRSYTQWIEPAPGLPSRTPTCLSAKQVIAKISAVERGERDKLLADELLKGNLPGFLRQWVKVEYTAKDTTGKEHSVAIKVMPDVLAVGTDTDWMRIPLTPMVAVRVAQAFGCQIPTRKLVNEIAKAATVKLIPLPLSKDRDAVDTWAKHHVLVEAQRAGATLGALVSGAKKDVVMSNLLHQRANRVAIHGWHYPDGSFIQPLTTVHVDWYVDYSHGVRLIHRDMTINGKPFDLRRVLYDAVMHPLVSDEGPLLRPAG